MAPEKEGGDSDTRAATPPTDHHHHHDQATCPDSNGESRQGVSAEVDFVGHLLKLGVAVWVARPGGDEFIRPGGWQKLMPEGSDERLAGFQVGMALCANMGSVVAVVDVPSQRRRHREGALRAGPAESAHASKQAAAVEPGSA